MANSNNPFGFRPIARLGGSPFSVSEYGKPASDSTSAIFAFDLLMKSATAVAMPERPDLNLTGVANANEGTAGTTLWVGVSMNYGAVSTATVHLVFDEVDIIYAVQGKTGVTYSTASHVGKNANVSFTTAGSTTTKISGMAVDGATIATTAGLDMRLLKISTVPPNMEGANAIFEVTILKSIFAQGAAGL